MKRKLGLAFISAVSALAIAGCSVEGMPTGAALGDAGGGHGKAWESEFNRGKESLASGHFGLALERFKSALGVNPGSPRIMNAVAVTYDRLGRHDLAQLYYDSALAIEPNSATTLNNLGYSMLTRERYEEALIYFEQALKQQQVAAERRMTNANRQLAMDRLRTARQRVDRQEIVQASLAAPADTSRQDCRMLAANAVGRSGARVFTLVTDTSSAESASGRGAVGNGALTWQCGNGARSRVAMINTAGPAKDGAAARAGASAAIVAAAPMPPAAATDRRAAPEQRPVPVAAKEKTEKAPVERTDSLRVEVSNGAGRNKLAARMRAYLGTKGLKVTYLTNAARFDNSRTTIFYKAGRRAAAESFAKLLPIPVEFVQVDKYFADIRIRLGADILDFDKKVLYAARTGEPNA